MGVCHDALCVIGVEMCQNFQFVYENGQRIAYHHNLLTKPYIYGTNPRNAMDKFKGLSIYFIRSAVITGEW